MVIKGNLWLIERKHIIIGAASTQVHMVMFYMCIYTTRGVGRAEKRMRVIKQFILRQSDSQDLTENEQILPGCAQLNNYTPRHASCTAFHFIAANRGTDMILIA